MVPGLDCDAVDNLASSLASLQGFFVAVEELRQLCAASSPTCISNADLATLVSLVEVAKGTMRRSGVRLHLFASCPTRLQEYKAAYFRLLRDLQHLSRCTRPGSQDLIERLGRLLFPLSTRFANGPLWASGDAPNRRSDVRDHSGPVKGARPAPLRSPAGSENLMPPPPTAPTNFLKRPRLASGRIIQRHKRPHITEAKQKYEEPSDGSNDSSESDSDDEADSYPVFVPARSPLRNSFGIFCTGRGRDGGVGTGTARAAYRTRGVIRPKQSTANAQRP